MARLVVHQVTSVTALVINEIGEGVTRTIRVQTISGEAIDLVLWAMTEDQLTIKAQSRKGSEKRKGIYRHPLYWARI